MQARKVDLAVVVATCVALWLIPFDSQGTPPRFDPANMIRCDSSQSDTLSARAVPHAMKVELQLGDGVPPIALYLTRDPAWFEPVSYFKREYWSPNSDSATLAIRRRVEINSYPYGVLDDWRRGRYGYAGFVGSVLWDHRTEQGGGYRDPRIEAEDREIELGQGDTLVDIGFMSLSGQPIPLLYSLVAQYPPVEEAYYYARTLSIWHAFGKRFVPLTSFELARIDNESDSYRRPHDLETKFRVDDVEPDADSEIVYSRTYLIANDGLQTSLSDPGQFVFEYQQGDPAPPPSNTFGNVSGISPHDPRYVPPVEPRKAVLAPTELILSDGSRLPTRQRLPFLLYPGNRWWEDNHSSPNMNEPIQLGEIARRNRFSKPSDLIAGPTLSIEIVDDSLQFTLQMAPDASESWLARNCATGIYSVVLWIDTDLYGDFPDGDANSDDAAFILFSCAADSTACVNRYSIVADHGAFELQHESQSFGMISYNHEYKEYKIWPSHARWRLSAKDIGLTSREGRPAACGFAAEVICGGSFVIDSFPYIASGWTYPVAFNRTDPRTWGMLMIAERKDTTYEVGY